ncbi:rhomboid family intramembrane serine protease [Streptomyces tubercidicus]|uniref:Rhomboid family intramembrane serine protease n=1 Tax=Streptomyces tubercidicus TaxID=47759 RepID=A0A640UUI6_9ACTN|nr:rhomboid family intramembrane serine protease [Streptomyces tubercidicus]WAU13403.1 rhomboid family intramembrane serine protease [Streptomyces tubercidicus]GFE39002.1 rhomboid family intramembrane serine protease [Streptomyces tubercidicus]
MTSRAKPAICLMLGWVALLWLLEGVDFATGGALDTFGITPREPAELADVVPAAFLHFGFGHLAANTLPLLLLGLVAALRSGVRRFVAVALLIILASGVGVWLTAAPGSNTAGASGVVFGLFGYLLVRGFIERKLLDIGIGLVVGVLYGSILWGALPTDSGISWQGHLFGLIGGVLAAFAFRVRAPGQLPAGEVRPVA